MYGSSLIEVLLAIWLVGAAALGTVGLQLWVARSQQSAQWQMQAVSLADAVAETLRGGASLGAAESAWRARIAKALPDGRVTALAKGPDIALVTVRWTEAHGWGGGPAHLHPDCPVAAGGRRARCVWLAVAQ
jgi:Tfp pilus assembly protein PilV